jgi:hypothetical protein
MIFLFPLRREELSWYYMSTREQIVWEIVKWSFYQSKIHYLGHVISDEGIVVDPKMFKAIMEWPSPKNVPEVHGFMVIAGYSRWFIEGFSKISNMITEL